MQITQQLFSENAISALGWTLVHALWQGVLTAIVLGILLVIMYRFSSRTRYFITVLALAFFLLMTTATFTVLYRAQQPSIAHLPTTVQPATEQVNAAPAGPLEELPVQWNKIKEETNEQLASMEILLMDIRDYFNQHLPLIVTIWLMGVVLLLLKFLGGLAYVQRIKNYKTAPLADHWVQMAANLGRQLQLNRPVRYLTSKIVVTPLTAGFLKPVIILPAKLLTGLSEKQVEGILLHELAHIRRNDYLVNILQSIIEILFFYHPAVWWMSARVRDERENCCDDIAIALTGETTGYAKALITVQETALQGKVPALAFAGSNKSQLTQRIRRIFNQPTLFADFREGFITAMILVGCVCGLAFGTPDFNAESQSTSEETSRFQNKMEKTLIETEEERYLPVSVTKEPPATEAEIPQTENEDLKLLLNAISEGNYEMVLFMIDKGVDVNAKTNNGWTPLLEAVNAGEFRIASLLLERGANINAATRSGMTPLILAASEGPPELVRLFLSKGADPEARTRDGATAFFHAVGEGQEDIVRLFIEEGADVNDTGYEEPPLILAINEGELDIIRLLLDNGADPNLKHPRNQQTAIQVAADEGEVDIIELLIERGAQFEPGSENGHYALLEAVEEDNFDMIQYLLDRGMDVNASRDHETALGRASQEGNYEMANFLIDKGAALSPASPGEELPPIGAAASEGHTNIVRLLLGKGADINATDIEGHTPLMMAAAEGYLETTRFLMENGASLEAVTRESERTALMFAAQEGQTEVVKFLLDRGANFNHQDESGRTALTEAIAENELEITEILIKAGADPQQQGDHHPSLIEAAGEGYLEMAKFLLSSGVDPNQTSDSGHTALMEASGEGELEMARFLIKSGARIDAATETGRTALFYAAGEGNLEIARLLISKGADVNALSSNNWMNVRKGNMTSYSIKKWTPLFEAVEEDEPELVLLLLKNGAQINHRITRIAYDLEKEIEERQLTRGWTPLMQAVHDQDEKIIEILLRNGADINAKTDDGTGLVEIARNTNNQKIIQLISSQMKR